MGIARLASFMAILSCGGSDPCPENYLPCGDDICCRDLVQVDCEEIPNTRESEGECVCKNSFLPCEGDATLTDVACCEDPYFGDCYAGEPCYGSGLACVNTPDGRACTECIDPASPGEGISCNDDDDCCGAALCESVVLGVGECVPEG